MDTLLDEALAAVSKLAARDITNPMHAQRAAKLCTIVDQIRRLFVMRVGAVGQELVRAGLGDDPEDYGIGVLGGIGLGRAPIAMPGAEAPFEIVREAVAHLGPIFIALTKQSADQTRRGQMEELVQLRDALADIGDSTVQVENRIRELGDVILKEKHDDSENLDDSDVPGRRSVADDGRWLEDPARLGAGDASGEGGDGEVEGARAQEKVDGEMARVDRQ